MPGPSGFPRESLSRCDYFCDNLCAGLSAGTEVAVPYLPGNVSIVTLAIFPVNLSRFA